MICLGLTMHWVHRQGKGFDTVQIGDTEERVIALMENPSKIDAFDTVEIEGTSNTQCSRRFTYYPPVAYFMPKYVTVDFDRSNRVVGKYDYESP